MSKELVKDRVIKYLVEDLLVPIDMIDTDVNLNEFDQDANGSLDIVVNAVEKDENNEEVYVPMMVVQCLDEDVSLNDKNVLDKQLELLEEIDNIVMAGRYILTNGDEMMYEDVYQDEEVKEIPNYETMLTYFQAEELIADEHSHDEILPLHKGCGCHGHDENHSCGCSEGHGCDCEDGCK